jgi:hypothetical protein
VNTAKAEADDPTKSDDSTVTAEATETVKTEDVNGELTVEKTADKTTGLNKGDVVTYSIVVTNTGNVTLTDVAVVDAKTGLNESIDVLAVSDSKSYTTTHTIDEADLLAGKFENVATADGKDPKGNDVHGEDSETVTTIVAGAGLAITKEAAKDEGLKLDEVVTYTIVVTNTGDVTLYNVKVDDEQTGLHTEIAELAAGESKTFTAEHKITEADILAGEYVNTAKAEADDPTKSDDSTVTAEATETVKTEDVNGELTVVKTADKTTGLNKGDVVTYTIVEA